MTKIYIPALDGSVGNEQEVSGPIINTNKNAAFQVIIPAATFIIGMVIRSRNANTITGGLKIGTTSGQTDVVAAQAVSGNTLIHLADTALLKRIFSASVDQTLFFDAVTSWNSAAIDLAILTQKVL